MLLEHKAVPVGGVEVIDAELGIVEAIVSVTGIVDRVRDVIMPGAYKSTLATRTPKGVWHHDIKSPVSKTLEIKELLPGDPDLPAELSDGTPWPKHAGALKVKTQFNLLGERGRQAFADVQFFGPEQEWSIGYRVPQGAAATKNGIRFCKEVDLYEYSPVLFGAMPHARSLVSVKEAQEAWSEVKSAIFGTCDDGNGTCCLSCGDKVDMEAKGDHTHDGDERWVVDFGDDAPEGQPDVVGTFGTKDAADTWADIFALSADADARPEVRPVDDTELKADGPDVDDETFVDFYGELHDQLMALVSDDSLWDAEKLVDLDLEEKGWAERLHPRGSTGQFIASAIRTTAGVASDVHRERRDREFPPKQRAMFRRSRADSSARRWRTVGTGVERSIARVQGRPPSQAAPRVIGGLFAARHLHPEERRDFKSQNLPTLDGDVQQMATEWANGHDKRYKRLMKVLPRLVDHLWDEPNLGTMSQLDLRRPRTPTFVKGDDELDDLDEKGLRKWTERLHPRGHGGKFASAPGGGGDGSGSPVHARVSVEQIEEIRSSGKTKVKVADADEAVTELLKGNDVELPDPDQVSILLDKVRALVQDAKDKGEDAPEINLCSVTVRNASIFCADSKGIPRIQMPQLSGKVDKFVEGSKASKLEPDAKGEASINDQFRQHLIDTGVDVETTRIPADHLKATQNELNGAKVAGIAGAIEAGTYKEATLFVSRDGYVVDGHHRWAATLGADSRDGKLGDLDIPVDKIDMDILDILVEANKFAAEWGIPTANASNAADMAKKDDVDDLETKRYVSGWDEAKHPRDAKGKFTDSPGEAAMKRSLSAMQRGIESTADALSRLQMDEGDADEVSQAYFNSKTTPAVVDPNAPRMMTGNPGDSDWGATDAQHEAQLSRAVTGGLQVQLLSEDAGRRLGMDKTAITDLQLLTAASQSGRNMVNPDDRVQMATSFVGGKDLGEAYDNVMVDLTKKRRGRKAEAAKTLAEGLQVDMLTVFGQGWKDRMAKVPGPSRTELHEKKRKAVRNAKVTAASAVAVYAMLMIGIGAIQRKGDPAVDENGKKINKPGIPTTEDDAKKKAAADGAAPAAGAAPAEGDGTETSETPPEERVALVDVLPDLAIDDELLDEIHSFDTAGISDVLDIADDEVSIRAALAAVIHADEGDDVEADPALDPAADPAAPVEEEVVVEEKDWSNFDEALDFIDAEHKGLDSDDDFEAKADEDDLPWELKAAADDDDDIDEAIDELIHDLFGESFEGDPEDEAKFDPSLHPRGPDGKFAPRGGSAARGLRTVNRALQYGGGKNLLTRNARHKFAKRRFGKAQKMTWRRERLLAKVQRRKPSRQLAKLEAAMVGSASLRPNERQKYLDDIGMNLNDMRRNVRRDFRTNGASPRIQARIERNLPALIDLWFRSESEAEAKAWDGLELELKYEASLDEVIAEWDAEHVFDLMAKMDPAELEELIEGVEEKAFWNSALHPRMPKGSMGGGRFITARAVARAVDTNDDYSLDDVDYADTDGGGLNITLAGRPIGKLTPDPELGDAGFYRPIAPNGQDVAPWDRGMEQVEAELFLVAYDDLTTAKRPSEEKAAPLAEATGGRVGGKGNKGNIKPIMRWFERGEGAAKIRWGTKGDFMRCVHLAEKHMNPEHARGFCNKRHRAVTGSAPGQGPHAGVPNLKKGLLDDGTFDVETKCVLCTGDLVDDTCTTCLGDFSAKGLRHFVEGMISRDGDGQFAPKGTSAMKKAVKRKVIKGAAKAAVVGGAGALIHHRGKKKGKAQASAPGGGGAVGSTLTSAISKRGKADSWVDTIDAMADMAGDPNSLLNHLVDKGYAKARGSDFQIDMQLALGAGIAKVHGGYDKARFPAFLATSQQLSKVYGLASPAGSKRLPRDIDWDLDTDVIETTGHEGTKRQWAADEHADLVVELKRQAGSSVVRKADEEPIETKGFEPPEGHVVLTEDEVWLMGARLRRVGSA